MARSGIYASESVCRNGTYCVSGDSEREMGCVVTWKEGWISRTLDTDARVGRSQKSTY